MIDEITVNRWLFKAAQKFSVKLFDRDTITVTEVTFPCLRKAYYDRVRKRLPTPVEALKMLGNEIHAMIQDIMKEEGWDIEVKVRLHLEGSELHGRADAIRYDEAGRAMEVIEIKTSNGVKEAALDSHILQLQVYMTILRAKHGYLIYVDRASGRVKVFRIRQDKRALKTVVERAKALHEALVNHKAPPPKRGPWCGLCPHKWSCWVTKGGK